MYTRQILGCCIFFLNQMYFFGLITKLTRIFQPYSTRVASWTAEFYVTYIVFHIYLPTNVIRYHSHKLNFLDRNIYWNADSRFALYIFSTFYGSRNFIIMFSLPLMSPDPGQFTFFSSIIFAVIWFSNLNGDFLDVSALTRQSTELQATFINHATKAMWREHYTVHIWLVVLSTRAHVREHYTVNIWLVVLSTRAHVREHYTVNNWLLVLSTKT
jgi:hypothetical protein